MNQKCFSINGGEIDISNYVNEIIEKGWRIVSLNVVPLDGILSAVILAENPAAAPLNLTFNKK